MTKKHDALLEELIRLLKGGSAHVSFSEAVKGVPLPMRGLVLEHLPYSIWQIVEHIRIAQWDMLSFSRDKDHQSPSWPKGYWPKNPAPEGDKAWRQSIRQVENDRDEFIEMLSTADIHERIPHGDGQTILREALQIADHNAYHTGEIVVIRRLLGVWNS